jgi:hypothetical protein
MQLKHNFVGYFQPMQQKKKVHSLGTNTNLTLSSCSSLWESVFYHLEVFLGLLPNKLMFTKKIDSILQLNNCGWIRISHA